MKKRDEMTEFERDRIELIATQTLLKCLIRTLFIDRPDRDVQQFAELFALSCMTCRFYDGFSEAKEIAAREIMTETGHDMISSALAPTVRPKKHKSK